MDLRRTVSGSKSTTKEDIGSMWGSIGLCNAMPVQTIL